MRQRRVTTPAATAIVLGLTLASPVSLVARTAIAPAPNHFTPAQDAQLGRAAAEQLRRQYPIVEDARIASYLDVLGRRLVAAAPPGLDDPAYAYSFTAVNLNEINAFALPGGPVFVTRGLFDAAESEAEVAGVLAHELSHVLLRHVTAGATKAGIRSLEPDQLASLLGGLPSTFSRQFETEADVLGARTMARAGYDPRALAHLFATIARDAAASGHNAPEWASTHPSARRRTRCVVKEAKSLTIAAAADTSQFATVKAAFASLPRGQTTVVGTVDSVHATTKGTR